MIYCRFSARALQPQGDGWNFQDNFANTAGTDSKFSQWLSFSSMRRMTSMDRLGGWSFHSVLLPDTRSMIPNCLHYNPRCSKPFPPSPWWTVIMKWNIHEKLRTWTLTLSWLVLNYCLWLCVQLCTVSYEQQCWDGRGEMTYALVNQNLRRTREQ